MGLRKILLVEDEPDLLEIVKDFLEYEMEDVGVITARNSREAIDLLEDDDGIVCILSDYFMAGGNGDAIFKYNKANKNLPFSIFTGSNFEELKNLEDFKPDNNKNFLLFKPVHEEKLLLAIESMVQSFDQEPKLDNVKKYKKVRTTLVKRYLDIRADFYVKLSENKYVKILDETEAIDLEVIEKYESRGQEFLFMEEVAYREFFRTTKPQIEKKVRESVGVETLKSMEDVLNYVHDGLRNWGVNQLQIDLVADSVTKCLDELNDIPSLRKFVSRFKSTSGYLVAHSVIAVHTALMIVKHTDYNNEKILKKMTFSALLHDIGLPNSKLSKVIRKDMSEFEELSQKEKDIVLSHPVLVAQVVGNFHTIPRDVITIIREHHERPDGSGFPRGMNANMISPLSRIFIIANEMADFMALNNLDTEYAEGLIQYLRDNFMIGKFEKIVEAAEKAIRE